MEPILITVKRSDEDREYDLAIQPDVPLSKLVGFIAQELGWSPEVVYFEIKENLRGTKLDPTKTLAEANVSDGASLEIIPAKKPSPREEENDGWHFIPID